MRVLLVEDDTMAALAIQRELGGRFDLRLAVNLAEALGVLGQGCLAPRRGAGQSQPARFARCRHPACVAGAALGTPVVVSTGAVSDALRRQLEALSAAALQDRMAGASAASRRLPASGRARSR